MSCDDELEFEGRLLELLVSRLGLQASWSGRRGWDLETGAGFCPLPLKLVPGRLRPKLLELEFERTLQRVEE